MNLKENDQIPNSEVFILENNEPVKKRLHDLLSGKKAVLFGLPGAYTSVCSAKHLPGYVNNFEHYKAKGIDHIICVSVNDPFLNFTKSIGADVDKSARGLGIRSNRYTMLIDDLKVVKLQEEDDTGACEISAAENFLKLV
jgi:peroxiredoxin